MGSLSFILVFQLSLLFSYVFENLTLVQCIGQIRGNPAARLVKEEVGTDDSIGQECQRVNRIGWRIEVEDENVLANSLHKASSNGGTVPMDIDVTPTAEVGGAVPGIKRMNSDDFDTLLSFSKMKKNPVAKPQELEIEKDNEFDDMATLDQVFARKRPGSSLKRTDDGEPLKVFTPKQIEPVVVKDELDEFKSAEVLHNLHKCHAPVEGLAALRAATQFERERSMNSDREGAKRVIIVGAGPAGLAAARHMQRMGFHVTVLEARHRVGGRVYTDRTTFSAPVDLGASIITGTNPPCKKT